MNSKIIVNLEALSNEYIPEKLLNRDKQINQLSNLMGMANTFVYGSTGSGKTLLIKHVTEQNNTTKKGIAVYIDCSLYQTTNAIFHEILTALNSIVVSKSNYDLTKRLIEGLPINCHFHGSSQLTVNTRIGASLSGNIIYS